MRQTDAVYRAMCDSLDPAPLGGAAAVMRDGGDVGDRGDLETGGLERADRLLATGARTLDVDLDLAHAVLHRALGGAIGGQGGGVRRALARALEPGHAGRAPAHDGTGHVGDRDDRVVERRLDVNVPLRDVLPLAPALFGRLLPFSHACSRSSLLLAPHADRLLRSAPLASVRLGPLPADGQVAAVPRAAGRADLDEPFDVQRDLAPEVALDLVAAIDELAESVDLLFGQVADPRVGVDVGLGQDLLARRQTEAEDIGEGDLDPLLPRNVDAGDPCHRLPLPLLVLRIGADDHDRPVSADDFAVVAAGLDGGSDFHGFLVRGGRSGAIT